ncbi:MarR family winged helix-turn-helix transcriptional regulator [Saccharopolyspora erythraea]|uniref:MarR family winged helix-turn-helix transcriptional regulator n=1 Tax=Saccharopolyspora erythraea TaxID=1836 RepID=UPI0020130AE2|nr:MarR family transcriptional regulator [Saccharopolyspora erythraea]
MSGNDRRAGRMTSDPDLVALSARLLFALQRELFDTLAERGYDDLTPRHGAVLAYLDESGLRASELARLSGQHKQIIGTIVDELEALGYVERRPDPADRRAKLVVPTERGRAEQREADAVIAAIEHRHARALPPQRYARFKDDLRAVTERQRSR